MHNRYFKRVEFACKCGCGYDPVDVDLLDVLMTVRESFGQPVTITSGCRCPEHNKRVGGAPKSQHIFGKAADIRVQGVMSEVVASFLEQMYPDRYGIGNAVNFTHIDVKEGKPRRWTY